MDKRDAKIIVSLTDGEPAVSFGGSTSACLGLIGYAVSILAHYEGTTAGAMLRELADACDKSDETIGTWPGIVPTDDGEGTP